MATSSRRHGVSIGDEELESALRRIEVELEKRQQANYQVEAESTRRVRSQLPRITGVVLDDSVVGAFSVKWDSSDANISRYEVELADNEAFTSSTSFRVNVPFFVLPTTLDPEASYSLRVRAVGTRVKRGFHDLGDWSATLTINPGQATFTNLQTGAAGNIILYEFTDTAFTILDLNGGNTTQTYVLNIPHFDLPTAATCLPVLSIQYDWNLLEDLDVITYTLYLDAENIAQHNKQFGDASITKFDSWRDTIAIVAPPQALAAGIHRLKLKIELASTEAGGSQSTLVTEKVVFSLLEVRR